MEEEGAREDAAWGEVVTSRTKKITGESNLNFIIPSMSYRTRTQTKS